MMDGKLTADGGDGNKPYTILNEQTITKLVQHKIMEVSGVLRVTRGTACNLLLHRNWNLDSDFWRWVENQPEIWNPNQTSPISSSENFCKICYETVENMVSDQCGHPFCVDCWKTYTTTSVNEAGPACLTMPCPEPACKSLAGLDMVDSLAPEDVKDRYYKYLYRSYVERSGEMRKWCPAPGCDSAIEIHGECHVAVRCDCLYSFCWNCAAESHRPVSCAKAAEWLEKDSSVAENVLWILNNTKACPKCHRPIEKVDGCNHITCPRPCNFNICWVCFRRIENHKTDSSCKEIAGNRKNVEKDFDINYMTWYERWDYYEKLRRRCVAELDICTLARVQRYAVDEVQCVIEAREQMVECRRLMKWSFVYGYYLSLGKDTRKKSFFELLQREAEDVFKRLQHCIEVEIKKYFDRPYREFHDFLTKLTNLR